MQSVAGIPAVCDFLSGALIADTGGEHRHLLQAVLDATPAASSILFDLPGVVEHAAVSDPDGSPSSPEGASPAGAVGPVHPRGVPA